VRDRKGLGVPPRSRAAERRGEATGFGTTTLPHTASLRSSPATKPRRAHIWEPDPDGFYIEPEWCSQRLLEAESFRGAIHDQAQGSGRIVRAAEAAGLVATGADIIDRTGGSPTFTLQNFLADDCRRPNIITNPPYHLLREFALHALQIVKHKAAFVFPVARLNAAHWLSDTPLQRVWLLTPRPSMPPGAYLAAGGKASGGTKDFAWLIWQQGFTGFPEIRWLHRRDGGRT
jgi:hypothetical protein